MHILPYLQKVSHTDSTQAAYKGLPFVIPYNRWNDAKRSMLYKVYNQMVEIKTRKQFIVGLSK